MSKKFEVDKTVLKKPTFYFGIIAALAPLVPIVQEYVLANPEMISVAIGLLLTAFGVKKK